MKIPLSQPDITDIERRAVQNVLKTSTLSLGPKQKEFEREMARHADRKYAIAVNSGTAGLHLIMRALGIKEGDEVITTPFSFIASANCILYEKAKPVFVDIEEKTLGIDPAKIEKAITKKTKAILAVDVFGHPADWDAILKVARKHKLLVIEDSAEAIGSLYKGKKCGSFGAASIFSFYPNKQITTGEGGVIITDSSRVAQECMSMQNQGRKVEGGRWLEHVQLGFNYRMAEIPCALGLAQAQRLKSILRKRERVAALYTKKLRLIQEVEIPFVAPYAKMSWFVYVIRLQKNFSRKQRDKVIEFLIKNGVQCRAYFETIHLQPLYRNLFGFAGGEFPVAESVSDRTCALPFFNALSESEIDYVVNTLKKGLAHVS